MRYERYRGYSYDERSSLATALLWLAILAAAAAIAAAITFFAGYVSNQGGDNYTGAGNQFTLTAEVTGITDHSVYVSNVRIITAHGAARKWFGSAGNFWSADHFELSDKYTDKDKNQHVVGSVRYSSNTDLGVEIPDLAPGMPIRVTGTIGDTQMDRSTLTQARFQSIVILSEP